jgi:invasion protein IalB
MSLFRCAPESLLFCSPIVEIPAANLSSSEKATRDFKSTTSAWGSYCHKSAVAAAPCSVSKKIFVLCCGQGCN